MKKILVLMCLLITNGVCFALPSNVEIPSYLGEEPPVTYKIYNDNKPMPNEETTVYLGDRMLFQGLIKAKCLKF